MHQHEQRQHENKRLAVESRTHSNYAAFNLVVNENIGSRCVKVGLLKLRQVFGCLKIMTAFLFFVLNDALTHVLAKLRLHGFFIFCTE